MASILITGATGNVGSEVVHYLSLQHKHRIVAAVRDIEKAKRQLADFDGLDFVKFDLENPNTFDKALSGIDRIFLLRPPHLARVGKYFKPFIDSVATNGITDVIFLSVQGAEKSKVIPHQRIENLIKKAELEFIFLRPSYFMQNLTSDLLDEIRSHQEIVLPAGNSPFNWVDVKNIAEVTAHLLDDFDNYRNQAYEITGPENMDFEQAAVILSDVLGTNVVYKDVSPFKFFSLKKRRDERTHKIIVMFLLHFMARFQSEPVVTNFYQQITGKPPSRLRDFVNRNKDIFLQKSL